MPEKRLGLSPICLCGCGQEVGHCESSILYHKDLYIFVKVSQVTIFYSSLDTFINTNTTPKGGAPAQAEYTSKKERKNVYALDYFKKDTKTSSIRYNVKFRNCQLTMLNVHFRYVQVVQ